MTQRFKLEDKERIYESYLSFPAGKERRKNRDKMIIQLVNLDYTMQDIGKLFGISKQRVHQIYNGKR